MDIKDLLKEKKQYVGKEIEICGWIKNHRPQKEFGFISFSDGTTQGGIQVVYDKTLNNFEDVSKLLVSSALKIKGTLVPSEIMKLKQTLLKFYPLVLRIIQFSQKGILVNF